MMSRCTFSLLFSVSAFLAFPTVINGNDVSPVTESPPHPTFEPFTGKVGRDKVRLRLHPSLESHIVKELSRGEPVAVVRQEDDFYAISPPSGTQFYVFRTYILDDIVEANRVNVRLEPSTEAPIVAQLNAGDSIQGHPAANNHKWYAIEPPRDCVFWVCKDYINHVGPAHIFAELKEKKSHIEAQFAKAAKIAQLETGPESNSFANREIIEDGIAALEDVIKNYPDFPEAVKKAKHELVALEENAIEIKVAEIEKKRHAVARSDKPANLEVPAVDPIPVATMPLPQISDTSLFPEMTKEDSLATFAFESHKKSLWKEKELKFFHAWQDSNPESNIDDFYQREYNQAVVMHGVVEPYEHLVKNKPGNFVLVNPTSRLPMAYLYSNHLPLENLVGREVSIKVAERPNNHFAYPAFYVLAIE